MSKTGLELSIQPSTTEDISEGLAFLNAQYQKTFKVSPTPPDHLLIARHDDRIVGTIGVNFWQPTSGLRLANLYHFDYVNAPLPVDLPATVEFGKWACEKIPGVSAALVYGAICFALSHQKKTVWCEHTPAVNRACRRFGIVFHEVQSARLDLSQIEECHRAFYDTNDAHLYMFDLLQSREALERYLKKP